MNLVPFAFRIPTQAGIQLKTRRRVCVRVRALNVLSFVLHLDLDLDFKLAFAAMDNQENETKRIFDVLFLFSYKNGKRRCKKGKKKEKKNSLCIGRLAHLSCITAQT